MLDIDYWRVVVTLGVPGLALGVFYALFKTFHWDFPIIPRAWAGPIVVLFMLIVGGIVFFALDRFAPSGSGLGTLPKECLEAYSRAREQLADGHFADAARNFTNVTIKCPEAPEAWRGLGTAQMKSGDSKQAVVSFTRALQLRPKDNDYKFNLASAYLERGLITEAIKLLTEVLSSTPDDMFAKYNLGVAFQKRGMFPEMEEQYKVVVDSKSQFAEAAAFNLAAEYANRTTGCETPDALRSIELLRMSLQFAQQIGMVENRLRRLTGQANTENGEKLATLRKCKNFKELISNSRL